MQIVCLLIVWLHLLGVFATLMILHPHLHWHNIYVAISWVQLCFRLSQCQFVMVIAIRGCRIVCANNRSIHTLCTNGGCLNRNISTANMIAFWLKRIHFITNSIVWLFFTSALHHLWLMDFSPKFHAIAFQLIDTFGSKNGDIFPKKKPIHQNIWRKLNELTVNYTFWY